MNAVETSVVPPGLLTDPALIRQFVFAGHARFTVVSKKSGIRHTYKVQTKKDKSVWFVSHLGGPDNTSDYRYIGVINDQGWFHHSEKSRVGSIAPCFILFQWFVKALHNPALLGQCEVWHEGRCCRCGRLLTVPESVARMIGPECEKHQ